MAITFDRSVVTFSAYLALSPARVLSRGRSCALINLKNINVMRNSAYNTDIANDAWYGAVIQAIKSSDAPELLIRGYNSRNSDGAFIASSALHSLMDLPKFPHLICALRFRITSRYKLAYTKILRGVQAPAPSPPPPPPHKYRRNSLFPIKDPDKV